MYITIVRESLVEILQKAGYFTSNKISDLKVFKGLLIQAEQSGITLKTTNINEYFSGEIGGKVAKTGEVLVDYKTFFELVKNLPDIKITLEKKNNQLLINSKSGQVKLMIMDANNFPAFTNNDKEISLPNELFVEKKIAPVMFSAASDEARPILTGICFDFRQDETRIVGTDGFRMSMYKTSLINKNLINQKLIVSAKSLGAILKIFKKGPKTINYCIENKNIVFIGDNTVVSSKLLEGEFPPYEKVIPELSETTIAVKKNELLEVVKSSSLFAKEGSNMVTLEIKKNNLTLKTSGSGIGEAVFNIELINFSGKENRIVFNYRYLLEYLNIIKDEEVVFEMSNPFAPGLFKSKKSSKYVHIIMPIRSQE